MKIVLIHGQSHKGSSYYLGHKAAENFQDAEILAEFFLPKDLNGFCTGCTRCLENEEYCPFWTGKEKILEKIEEADLLILTTPVYCMGCSAPMKSFLDLTFSYWLPHMPKASMFSKKALVITTAAGTGMKKTLSQVSSALTYWGISSIEKYGVALHAPGLEDLTVKKKEKIEKELLRKVQKLDRVKPETGIKVKILFEIMRRMISGYPDESSEKAYWKENGWLEEKRPWK